MLTVLLVSQMMIFFLLMTMRKTLGTGLIVLEKNISIKSMRKPRDLQQHLLGGKRKRVNKRESRKRKAIKSCMKSCRGSTKSIWLEQHVKRKRLGRARSAGMMRGAQPLSVAALQLTTQSWATVTFPGQLQGGPCRRWWTWCCTVWTERTYQRFVKCSGSSKLCGIPTNLLRDAKPGWRRRTSRGSWIQSQLCHRSSTDWLRVWGLKITI